MEPKYVEAIKAGIAGGIIIAVLELVSQLTVLVGVIRKDYYSPDVAGGLGLAALSICCCVFVLYLLTLLCTGALAARLAKASLKDLGDAVIVSAVAGGVAGLIWGVVSDIIRVLISLTSMDYAGISSRIGGSIFFGVCGLVCCLPAGVIIAVFVALIGGILYYGLTHKI